MGQYTGHSKAAPTFATKAYHERKERQELRAQMIREQYKLPTNDYVVSEHIFDRENEIMYV